MSMYVWKVSLEVEWKYTVKSINGKSVSRTDIDNDEHFTVAAPTGLKAIEVAKRIALHKDRGYEDDWSSADETVTALPLKVVDVVGLTLETTLDG